MKTSIKEKLILCAQQVEAALQGYLSRDHHHLEALARLEQAVKHASLAGGKRLRPFLVIETAHLFGVPAQEAMPAACAIEMVHSYSLVHDDLPAMDNADTRRGQPSVHKAFDEAIAILAGDALLTDAFALLTQGDYTGQVAMELV
ncbi:MAG: polyprenyl synthetase family protein, partial [Pseudomonadota bacterium]